MRICFITRKFPPTLSGMSTYAENLSRQLIFRGVDLCVLAQYRPDNLGDSGYGDAPPSPINGAKVIGIPQVNEIKSGAFEEDINVIVETAIHEHLKHPFDVIHAQYGYPCGVAAILIGRRLNLPAVVSLQGGDGHWFGTCCHQHKETLKWIISNASQVIYPTRSFYERVYKRTGRIGNNKILPGAVDTNIFSKNMKARKKWREKLTIPNHYIAVIYHGRLDFRKGLSELINGFSMLHHSLKSKSKLVIAGVGPDAENIKDILFNTLKPDNYSWLGHVAYCKIPQLLSASDIFCSPTYQEGFSNTLVEAASCGLPLLTTNTVGVHDVFKHGDTAWLVDVKTASAVTSGLHKLLTDHDTRIRLGNSAHQLVMERYSWTSLTETLLEIYKSINPIFVTCPDPPIRNLEERCKYRQNPLLL